MSIKGTPRTSHGMYGSPTYHTYWGMLARCTNPESVRWEDYGERGIKVCDSWRDCFENFLEDMGARPSGKTLDRLDGDGDYEPSNCRWATPDEQANNKSNTRRLCFGGRTQSTAQWDRELKLGKGATQARIDRYGWSVERALTTPGKEQHAARV